MNREDAKDAKENHKDDLSFNIIGAAIEVHRVLGPGLLESAYEESLCRELSLRNIAFERQCRSPYSTRGHNWTAGIDWTLSLSGLWL